MKYTPETGFLDSSRILTASVQKTRLIAIYIYMEYAVFFVTPSNLRDCLIVKLVIYHGLISILMPVLLP
ncbi:hypothetical protein QUB37_15630 [Microcoleus sp. AT3-A2]|uniref:hypothetical protein n=1 Tax=unclassified Microcoleus TaxID=2642155 RepID=UPI002FD1C97C